MFFKYIFIFYIFVYSTPFSDTSMFKHTHIDTSEMYTVYQLVPVCQRTPLTSSFFQAVRSANMKKTANQHPDVSDRHTVFLWRKLTVNAVTASLQVTVMCSTMNLRIDMGLPPVGPTSSLCVCVCACWKTTYLVSDSVCSNTVSFQVSYSA